MDERPKRARMRCSQERLGVYDGIRHASASYAWCTNEYADAQGGARAPVVTRLDTQQVGGAHWVGHATRKCARGLQSNEGGMVCGG
eukprot:scaffold2564_cov25-Tisochrysis_lutea.AAC.2